MAIRTADLSVTLPDDGACAPCAERVETETSNGTESHVFSASPLRV